MTDPTDKELLKFVAEFVGWSNFKKRGTLILGLETLYGLRDGELQPIPDYLNSVDAWLRDVWPKILLDTSLRDAWSWELSGTGMGALIMQIVANSANASARDRCLALWLALDGKLPEKGGAK